MEHLINENDNSRSEPRTGDKHFLYPLLNKSKRKQFKKIMELNWRAFNEKIAELSQSKRNNVSLI